jgi:hypothetical protein
MSDSADKRNNIEAWMGADRDHPWRRLGRAAERFPELIAYLGLESDLDAALDAAAAVLEVDTAANARAERLDLAERHLATERQIAHCIEIAIAHASRGWPLPLSGDLRMDSRPFRWIAVVVEVAVRRTLRWIENNVAPNIDWPDGAARFAETAADEITWPLIAGKCDCPALLRRGDNRYTTENARRPHVRHLTDHCLAAWNPAAESLWRFLDNAVTGRNAMLSGSIVQGMLYPLLVDAIDLRHANVALDICLMCHAAYPHADPECAACGEPRRPAGMPTDLDRRLVVERYRLRDDGRTISLFCKLLWWWCDPCEEARRLTNGHRAAHAFLDSGHAGRTGTCPLCHALCRARGRSRAEAYTHLHLDTSEEEQSADAD